jgi:hypothetical protein
MVSMAHRFIFNTRGCANPSKNKVRGTSGFPPCLIVSAQAPEGLAWICYYLMIFIQDSLEFPHQIHRVRKPKAKANCGIGIGEPS